MNKSSIIILIIIVGGIIWSLIWGGKLPIPFRKRSCQGKNWHKSFPDISKDEIRNFLALFVEAFAFKNTEKLKLNPNDQLLDIYRALYPHKWQADALEFETLSEVLETKYKINLNNIWHDDLTLGQLFSHIQNSKQSNDKSNKNCSEQPAPGDAK